MAQPDGTPHRRRASQSNPAIGVAAPSFASSFSSACSDSRKAGIAATDPLKRETPRSGEDDQLDGSQADAEFTSDEKRQLFLFWMAGLLNNSSYVIMIAGAKSIISGGVGLVFLAGTVPSVIMSMSAPYWFHKVPYGVRFCVAGVLMVASYCTVAFAPNKGVALIGVGFASMQSGLGEPSFLALSSWYPRKEAYLTAWSSGTGFAGVFGYGWICFIHTLGGLGFSATMLIANCLGVFWLVMCHFLIDRPPQVSWYSNKDDDELLLPGEVSDDVGLSAPCSTQREDEKAEVDAMSNKARLNFVCTRLWPYTIPLVIVYVSEYAMQSGAWAAIGFPVDDSDARDRFYLFANFSYQGGVFISRSSGLLFKATRPTLWLMPALQSALLVFFYTDAQYQYWYNWGLLGLCVCSGLLGGAVYVNALTLICSEIEVKYQEFSLTAVATAFSLGIVIANGFGLVMQCELYKVHHIGGAALDC